MLTFLKFTKIFFCWANLQVNTFHIQRIYLCIPRFPDKSQTDSYLFHLFGSLLHYPVYKNNFKYLLTLGFN